MTKYDLCIIDFFPKEFVDNNYERCLWESKFSDSEIKIPEGHGMAIVEIARLVNPDINFLFIPITPKTTLQEIINILAYLIDRNLCNVINMSFGFYECQLKEIVRLDKLCRRAVKKGICIVCADEDNGRKVYPASIKSVIRVRKNEELDANMDILIEGNNVYVKQTSFRVHWTKNRHIWVYGSSYYAGIVSGVMTLSKNHKKNIKQLSKYKLKEIASKIEMRTGCIDVFGNELISGKE